MFISVAMELEKLYTIEQVAEWIFVNEYLLFAVIDY